MINNTWYDIGYLEELASEAREHLKKGKYVQAGTDLIAYPKKLYNKYLKMTTYFK